MGKRLPFPSPRFAFYVLRFRFGVCARRPQRLLYYGYLLHQLPKKYEEISMLDQFNLGGFTYISEYAVELTKNQLDTRTSNVSLGNLKTI